MMHLSEEDLILLYYGEPGAPAHARAHLADCSDCARQARSLAALLNECKNWPATEPAPGFETRLWRGIAARLPEKSTGRPRFRLFAVAAALACLVVVAFLVGRLTTHTPTPLTAGLSAQARERVLRISLADHLDRAEILLTNLSNGIAPDRGRAADLVSEGRLLRSALVTSGDAGTLALVDDVERFLLEAANEPEHPADVEMATLRRRIEDDSLIFKIRIIKSNLRTRGQQS